MYSNFKLLRETTDAGIVEVFQSLCSVFFVFLCACKQLLDAWVCGEPVLGIVSFFFSLK